MSLLTAPTFVFAPGDTWVMPVTYRNPNNADGTPGTPINLTGSTCSGILFTRGNAVGLTLSIGNGGVTVDPTNGVMTFIVNEAVTANFAADVIPPYADSYNFPTRLQVRVRDTAGNIETIAVFPIQVLSPRTAELSSYPMSQAGSVSANGAQGPVGPVAGILTKPALAPISGHTAVKSGLGGVLPASSGSVGDAGSVLGISLNAATGAGQAVQVATDGEVFEQTWSWSAGPVFLGLAGALTQTPPTSGFLQQVGIASSSTSIIVAIQDPTVRP